MADRPSVVAKWNAAAAEMQAIGGSPPPPPPPVLAVGARCKVIAIAKVRPQPDGSNTPPPPTQPVGALGTVIAPGLVNGYWKVDFDTGADGYVWAANIVAV